MTGHPILIYIGTLLAGILLGRVGAGWAIALLGDEGAHHLLTCSRCQARTSSLSRWIGIRGIRCAKCGLTATSRWPVFAACGVGFLFLCYAYWLTGPAVCQKVSEVQPIDGSYYPRLAFHMVFLFLLSVATMTDLVDYIVPDEVVLAGIVTAVCGATISGDLQVIHVWVDWSYELVELTGAYLPTWMKEHQHLHGFVWSVAGLLCGASLTWLLRFIAGRILGYPALGFGDVTLMAMIGAFMGWQPALCVLAIAPLTGTVVGVVVWLLTGRTFVAYGPYLAASAVIVLCTWRWIWADFLLLRDVFSHWPTVLALVTGAYVVLAFLLIALRVFRSLPTERIRR